MIHDQEIRRELADAQRAFVAAAREGGGSRERYDRALERLLAAGDQARMRA